MNAIDRTVNADMIKFAIDSIVEKRVFLYERENYRKNYTSRSKLLVKFVKMIIKY